MAARGGDGAAPQRLLELQRLLAAARGGDEAALQRLLERARRPAQLLTAVDAQGYTALHLAAREGHEGCVRRLVAAGAPLDAGGAGEKSDTPLHASCRAGQAGSARLLLEAGASVHQHNRGGAGGTPLFIACQEGHADCARLCLEAGANVEAAADDGATPLYIACQEGHTSCARLCLEAGADVNQADNDRCTPLFMACHQGHTDCARLCLEAGANVEAALEEEGATPLWIACGKGHTDCARLCLEAGANVEAALKEGGATPLLVAVHQGHLATVQLLCLHSANRDPPNTEDTAESVAEEMGHDELLAWLQRTRDFSTPLHHLELLSAARARALLRAGAALGARARPGAPSPLELARQLLRQPQPAATAATNAAGHEAAGLVELAAQPWSPQTHELWPARGRARAEALVRLGWRLSSTDRSPGPFGNEAQSIMDAWRGLVMVHALVRAEWEA